MIRTLADPWLAQNAGRKYPLADDVDTVIPDNAILNFRCTVRGVSGPVSASVTIPDSGTDPVTVVLTQGGEHVATLLFDVPESPAEGVYHTLQAVSENASGTLTFTAALRDATAYGVTAELARTTITVDSLGIDSLVGARRVSYAADGKHHIDDGTDVTLTGEIVLDLGANTDPYLDGRRLRLEIAKGGGRGEWCQYQEANQNCGNVLFTVNGERPGSDGDLKLVGEGGIIVTPKPEEHVLEISIEKASSDLMTKDCTAAC